VLRRACRDDDVAADVWVYISRCAHDFLLLPLPLTLTPVRMCDV